MAGSVRRGIQGSKHLGTGATFGLARTTLIVPGEMGFLFLDTIKHAAVVGRASLAQWNAHVYHMFRSFFDEQKAAARL